jgi:hypothetical protein
LGPGPLLIETSVTILLFTKELARAIAPLIGPVGTNDGIMINTCFI